MKKPKLTCVISEVLYILSLIMDYEYVNLFVHAIKLYVPIVSHIILSLIPPSYSSICTVHRLPIGWNSTWRVM